MRLRRARGPRCVLCCLVQSSTQHRAGFLPYRRISMIFIKRYKLQTAPMLQSNRKRRSLSFNYFNSDPLCTRTGPRGKGDFAHERVLTAGSRTDAYRKAARHLPYDRSVAGVGSPLFVVLFRHIHPSLTIGQVIIAAPVR